MGDKQNALALSLQGAHDIHKLLDLLGRQHGSRLIKDQDLIIPIEHFQDLRALLHAHGDIFYAGIRIHIQPILFRKGHDLFAGSLLLQEPQLCRLHAHDDIIQHGKALHQFEMLVDHADAKSVGIVWIFDGNGLPVLADAACLRLIQTEKNRHEGGFSCTVLPQQSMYLSPPELQSDVVIGDDTRELLRDVQHLDSIIRFQDMAPSLLHSVLPEAAPCILNISIL